MRQLLLFIITLCVAIGQQVAHAQNQILPELLEPTAGGTFIGNTATFEWTAHDSIVTEWRFQAGKTYQSNDIYDSGELPPNITALTVTDLPTNLPVNDDTIHVTLHYRIDDLWQQTNYAYTAINLPQTSCIDWDFFSFDGKLLFNSPWGQFYFPSGGWSECITLSLADDGSILPSWEYDWLEKNASTNPYAVKAFPEVIFGNKSGDKISGTQAHTGIPVRLKNMPDFTIDLAYQEYGGPTESPPSAARNVAIESFFHGQPTDDGTEECMILGAGNPQGLPGNRQYEIMVWLEAPDASTQVKPSKASDQIFKTDINGNNIPIIIDSREYNVWINAGQEHSYIAFVATQTHSDANHRGSVTVKWSSFVQWVRENRTLHGNPPLNENWCMGAFEFGTEIWWGAGKLEVLQFDVTATDETDPQILFSTPSAANSGLALAPTLTGQILDRGGSGIEAVRIALKNQTNGNWLNFSDNTFQSAFSYTLATLTNNTTSESDWQVLTNLPAGQYKLLALPFDKAGNYPTTSNGRKDYYTQRFSVHADTAAPDITITSAGSNGDTLTRTFTGTATDSESSIATVRLALKNQTSAEWYNFNTEAFGSSFSHHNATLTETDPTTANWIQTTTLPPGDYKLFAAAIDSVGNYAKNASGSRTYVTQRFSITADETPPQTVIDFPAANSELSISGPTLTGNASDQNGSGINSVRVAIRNLDTNTWWDFSTNDFDLSFSHTQALVNPTSATAANWQVDTSLPSGRYKLFALATDNQGNYLLNDSGNRHYTTLRFTIVESE